MHVFLNIERNTGVHVWVCVWFYSIDCYHNRCVVVCEVLFPLSSCLVLYCWENLHILTYKRVTVSGGVLGSVQDQCVCVCVRERERGGGEGERVCV